MYTEAEQHLSTIDPVLKSLIERHGTIRLERPKVFRPFPVLVSAIANQQLNNKAAATILQRFKDLFQGRFPAPAALSRVSDEQIRACGFSRAKVAAIRDLAEKCQRRQIPGGKACLTMSDEELLGSFDQVRGIGPWTVEMMLIFRLGRPDVWPLDDYGVQTGLRLAFGLTEHPGKKEMLARGEKWRPYRTTAALHFWKHLDEGRK